MTASANNSGVYIVGKKSVDIEQQSNPNHMSIRDAIKLISEYKKNTAGG